MRRWVTVWVGTVVGLLVAWGVTVVLTDALTTHDNRPATVEVHVVPPAGDLDGTP